MDMKKLSLLHREAGLVSIRFLDSRIYTHLMEGIEVKYDNGETIIHNGLKKAEESLDIQYIKATHRVFDIGIGDSDIPLGLNVAAMWYDMRTQFPQIVHQIKNLDNYPYCGLAADIMHHICLIMKNENRSTIQFLQVHQVKDGYMVTDVLDAEFTCEEINKYKSQTDRWNEIPQYAHRAVVAAYYKNYQASGYTKPYPIHIVYVPKWQAFPKP